jgi:multiple sugar transport system substrate-binding protein
LEPLDSYFTADELKNIVQLDANKYAGKLYGIPWTNGSAVWYYNKALFTKAGLDPEKFPTTWDELLKTCKALKDVNITPYGGGNKESFQAVMLADLMFKDSVNKHYQMLEPVLGKTSWSDKNFLQFFEDTNDMKAYMNEDMTSLSYYQGVDLFGTKDVAMALAVNSNGPTWVKDQLLDDKDIGVATPPARTDKTAFSGTITTTAYDWILTPYSKNKQEGANFIKFMISKDRVNALYTASKAIPASNLFDVSLVGSAVEKAIFEFPKAQSCFQDFIPQTVQYDGLGPAFSNVINGSMTPEQAAKHVDDISKKWRDENPEQLDQYMQWYDALKSSDY